MEWIVHYTKLYIPYCRAFEDYADAKTFANELREIAGYEDIYIDNDPYPFA